MGNQTNLKDRSKDDGVQDDASGKNEEGFTLHFGCAVLVLIIFIASSFIIVW